jgi:hypothetical protein
VDQTAPRVVEARCSARLFGSLLGQADADVQGVVGIHSAIVKFDVLDFPFFVDDDGGAPRPFEIVTLHVVFFQDAIIGEGLAIHVAEERHGDADLFGEGGVGGGTVDADTEDYCVAGFELGLISLIGLEFFRSTTCECQDVESKNDIFLAAEITQLDRLPLVAEKSEVRSHVAHFQSGLGNGFLLLLSGGGKLRHHEQQKQAGNCQDASLHLGSPFENELPYEGIIGLREG